jgi:hypothetical protein
MYIMANTIFLETSDGKSFIKNIQEGVYETSPILTKEEDDLYPSYMRQMFPNMMLLREVSSGGTNRKDFEKWRIDDMKTQNQFNDMVSRQKELLDKIAVNRPKQMDPIDAKLLEFKPICIHARTFLEKRDNVILIRLDQFYKHLLVKNPNLKYKKIIEHFEKGHSKICQFFMSQTIVRFICV